MNLQAENILKLFVKTAKFDFCALVNLRSDNYTVTCMGNKNIENSKLFADFLDRLLYSLNGDVSAVDNDELFNTFLSFYKFNQYYIKLILSKNNINIFFLGFSKKFYKNTKFLNETRNDLESILVEFITNKLETLVVSERLKKQNYLSIFEDVFNKSELILYLLENGKYNFDFSLQSASTLFDIEESELNNKFTKEYLYSKIDGNSWDKLKEFEHNLNTLGMATGDFSIRTDLGIAKIISDFAITNKNNSNLIAGIIRNISKEKNLELRAEKSEIITNCLSELSDNLVFFLNSNGYINFINDYGAITLGYVREDLIGKHLFEFISENSKSDSVLAFQKALETEGRIVFGAKVLDRFKNNMDFEFNIKAVKQNNSVVGLMGVAIDVTDKIKSEIQLRELNAKIFELNRLIAIEKDRAKHQISLLEELNKLKNEFISNVSHEFRTPLASIIGFAETIDSDRDLPAEMIFEFNRIILDEGKRLAKLINDILDFSKLENGGEVLDKQKANLVEIIYDVFVSLIKSANKKGITINKQIPDAEIIINCDKDRINKVFYNLLANAIKFTKNDGFVSIIVQDFLKEVEVIISDTGIGIAKDDIPKLFQKFTKIERPGSILPGAGFGLPVVKQIVDLHKGLIRVESEINKGSTFIIRLPKE
ncbi:MAG TPA: PAS domain-containing sensor histidine kinase [Melioribacteraceae bacterium]|nr:PAS domain-containing sensor histidine kinase [Melioribacteraceae bacterium]